MSLYSTGVCDDVFARVVNGRLQSSAPVSSDTPTKCSCVKTTTCRVPPSSKIIGEP